VDSAFTLAATSGVDSAYALAHLETAPAYAAKLTQANIPGADRAPTIERLATGRYRVSFTGAPANFGGNVQAAAVGATTNYCKVAA
jgi:hypothetical protein